MKAPSDHMKTLRRRVDFLKSRELKTSFVLAELGALEWAIVNLQTQPAPVLAVAWFWLDDKEDEWKHLADNQADADKYLPLKVVPLYTTPPAAQRQWVGLTDEELSDAYVLGGLRLVQEKIKVRNNG